MPFSCSLHPVLLVKHGQIAGLPTSPRSIRHLCGAAKPVSRKDSEHHCTLASVVPLGPHEVEITVDVAGGDVQQADASLLTWEDAAEALPPDEVSAVERRCNSAVLVYRNVVLSKPLRFTFGGKACERGEAGR